MLDESKSHRRAHDLAGVAALFGVMILTGTGPAGLGS
jgi:hypothetical protein